MLNNGLNNIKRNNMNPKEKAQDIFDKMLFCYQGHIDEYTAKQCALIAVDEIFEFMKMDDDHHEDAHFANSHWVHYLVAVKEEIKKL